MARQDETMEASTVSRRELIRVVGAAAAAITIWFPSRAAGWSGSLRAPARD
jgi:hypothetical protein